MIDDRDRHKYRRVTDENGQQIMIPKEYSEVINPGESFPIHDTSLGHCALCGRLGCHGSCFK